MTDAPIEDQTRRVFDDLKAALAAAGLTMDVSSRRRSSLRIWNEFGKMNEAKIDRYFLGTGVALADVFTRARPTRRGPESVHRTVTRRPAAKSGTRPFP